MIGITSSPIANGHLNILSSHYQEKLSQVSMIIDSMMEQINNISQNFNDLKQNLTILKVKEERHHYEKHTRTWQIVYTIFETLKFSGVTIPSCFMVGIYTGYPLVSMGVGTIATIIASEIQVQQDAKVMAELFELKTLVYLRFHPKASVQEAASHAQKALSTLDFRDASYYYQKYKKFVDGNPKEFRLVELYIKKIKEKIKTQEAIELDQFEQISNIW